MFVEIGATGWASMTVSESDLATALNQVPTDGFPAVLATARMIGLMELAASRAMHSALKDGELSVGVSLNVTHSAATPAGVSVEAEATLIAMDGKFYVFEVVARDPGGEIGRGEHKRAIVQSERLLQGAKRRCNTSV